MLHSPPLSSNPHQQIELVLSDFKLGSVRCLKMWQSLFENSVLCSSLLYESLPLTQESLSPPLFSTA